MKAIKYCVQNKLWSASSFVSVVNNLDKLSDKKYISDHNSKLNLEAIDNIYMIETETRNLSEYEKLVR